MHVPLSRLSQNSNLANRLRWGRELQLSNLGPSLNPTTVGIVDALVAAGATVSPAQVSAIDVFVVGEIEAGRWGTEVKRLFWPVWGVVAANAIDWITLGSGTFNGSVTHDAGGYVYGDGSTGYFAFGVTYADLGMTASDAHLLAGRISDTGTASRSMIGARPDASQQYYIDASGIEISRVSRHYTFNTAYSSIGGPLGIFLSSLSDGSNTRLRKIDGSGITEGATHSKVGSIPTTSPLEAMRRHLGAPDMYDNGQHVCWSAGGSITDPSGYLTSMAALYTGLTENTLPA